MQHLILPHWRQTILKPEHFGQIAASILHNPLKDHIQQASQREAQVLEGLQELKQKGLQQMANGIAEWEEDGGLVYHRGCMYVPPDNRL